MKPPPPPTRHAAPTRKRNLFTYVVEEVGARIVRGDPPPGAVLPTEPELGQQLGASRSVIREAVKSLAAKGLVEVRTRIGTRVLPSVYWNLLDLDVLRWRFASLPRDQFFRELFEIRRMIEPAAAALAADRATDDDLAELERACRAMEEVRDGSAAVDADLHFHRTVLASSHNDLLLQMGALIGVGLQASHRASPDSYEIFVPSHRKVLDGIRDRQPARARAAMDDLLVRTRDYLERDMRDSARASASGRSRAQRR